MAPSEELNFFYLCGTTCQTWFILLVISGLHQWLPKWVLRPAAPAAPRSLIQMQTLGLQPSPDWGTRAVGGGNLIHKPSGWLWHGLKSEKGWGRPVQSSYDFCGPAAVRCIALAMKYAAPKCQGHARTRPFSLVARSLLLQPGWGALLQTAGRAQVEPYILLRPEEWQLPGLIILLAEVRSSHRANLPKA